MNLREAEEVLEILKPNVTYIESTVLKEHDHFEENMREYIELSERISSAKVDFDIHGFEDVIQACEDIKTFYSIDNLILLYKYEIKDEDIQKCKEKIKEANKTIELTNTLLDQLKGDIEV